MDLTEITRLAAAINALRPDWPQASLVTFISQNLADRSWRDASVALAMCATDPETRTPARVLEAGDWWDAVAIAAGKQPATPTPGRLDHTVCRKCGAIATEPNHHEHCGHRAQPGARQRAFAQQEQP